MPSKIKRLRHERSELYRDAPIGLCFLDTHLRYLQINQWLAALNGLPMEAHLGRTVREVLPAVAAGVEDQLRYVIDTGQPIIDGRVDAETPAQPGVMRSFLHNYFPRRNADGQVEGVNCVVTEITKRQGYPDIPVFVCGDLSVQFPRREVRVGGKLVKLTPTEYRLLIYLIEHAHTVLTHQQLLAAIWGPDAIERLEYLRVFVGQLRRKLERDPANPRFILTHPGIGYHFSTE